MPLCIAAPTQAGQPIPGYFYGNENFHSKGQKSSETKMGRMEDPTFATPVHKVHYEIAIHEPWHFRTSQSK